MGVELKGKGGYMSLNWTAWGRLLDLACQHGWEPEGTKWTGSPGEKYGFVPIASHPDWEGGYFSNDSQEVAATDAMKLAESLERALEDPSYGRVDGRGPQLVGGEHALMLDRVAAAVCSDMGAGVKAVPAPAGLDSDWVQTFISFCRAGSFEIW